MTFILRLTSSYSIKTRRITCTRQKEIIFYIRYLTTLKLFSPQIL